MWLLASRGRPSSLQRFIDAYLKTNSSTTVYLRLDLCDETLNEYKKIKLPETFILIIDKRARLGAAMKEIFETYPNEPWYGLLADDLVPRTLHWDIRMIEAAGDRYISQANDLSPKPKNYCHPCIGGELVRKAGFFGFPYTTHYALEVIWKDLTKCDKRFGRYLPDVIVENLHPDFNKGQIDRTYQEAFTVKDNDERIWKAWRGKEFDNFYLSVKDLL
jgi:hypothetical protein